MPKHIKIRASLSPKMKTVRLHLIQQSHAGPEFGPEKYNRVNWYGQPTVVGSKFSHRRVRIASNELDHARNCLYLYNDIYDDLITLWVSHKPVAEMKNKTTAGVHIKHWPQVKAAIEAYNAWGATQE